MDQKYHNITSMQGILPEKFAEVYPYVTLAISFKPS